jgi:leucyl aminopeptidase (aminopeptidase T)
VLDEDAEVDAEVVDGLPVVAEEPGDVQAAPEARLPAVPAVHAAALAATGFAVGVTTAAVVTRRRARKAAKRRRKKVGALGEIVSSNSFLVDVHLLRRD